VATTEYKCSPDNRSDGVLMHAVAVTDGEPSTVTLCNRPAQRETNEDFESTDTSIRCRHCHRVLIGLR
jgi:DNA-directed RNA polymerase subunit RPC12/RpoP